ncbi:ABC transporter permease [Desertimonas flava]|uniref:ABC transporter permease n=1 Tax=Desertimonas flava TaxID=2064846 RepID=UPI000E344C4A|nr:FtsX-like permease family protein [Desertimonas flava]
MNGLARASIRSRPASFLGTFVALLLASVVVMACGSLLQTGLTARVQPVRYADAPIVVSADQFARRIVGSGDDREEVKGVLPEGARLDASLADTIVSVPGVADAVPDVAVALIGDDVGSVTGRDWSTRRLGAGADAAALVEGSAPGTDDVVLDEQTARESGLSVGDSVTLTAPDGAHDFRVSGLVPERVATAADGPSGRRATAWFADGVAASLAGQPGRADAIAVFVDEAADVDDMAAAVRGALDAEVPDAGVTVRTGSGRGEIEAPDLPTAKELLIGFGGSFGGVAAFAAVFVVITTVALAIGQRGREIALLRAIGATPKQIRRMVATQTLLVAPLAGAAGILPGILLARWWFGQLVDRGALPYGLDLHTGVVPAAAAVVAGLLAALLGGYAAARRPARTKPSQALGEAAVERRGLGRVRWVFGALFIALGVFLSIISYQLDGGSAAVASIGVVMTFLTAVALLGPAIARMATALFGRPLSRGGAASSLAAANAAANSRRLASAITPIALVIGSSGVLLFIQSTVAEATRSDIRSGLVADLVIAADGPGLPSTTTVLASAVPGVDTAVGLLRSDVLYNGFEEFESAAAIGVSDLARLDEVLDLGVTDGSLTEVREGTVALDNLLARSLDADVGDTVDLRLGDGTEHSPTVVAVYEHGLGLGQVLLPHDLMARHVRAPFLAEVLVALEAGADPEVVGTGLEAIDVPGAAVTDRDGYSARVDADLELDTWSNRVMAAVFGGFAAIAAVNTLVMVVLDRRREVALLRLTGTTRRQVQAMFRWEAAIVALTGIGLGTAIAFITLRGFAKGATDGLPYVPPLQGLGVVAVAALIAFGAMAVPARALLRRPSRAGGE